MMRMSYAHDSDDEGQGRVTVGWRTHCIGFYIHVEEE